MKNNSFFKLLVYFPTRNFILPYYLHYYTFSVVRLGNNYIILQENSFSIQSYENEYALFYSFSMQIYAIFLNILILTFQLFLNNSPTSFNRNVKNKKFSRIFKQHITKFQQCSNSSTPDVKKPEATFQLINCPYYYY